MKRVLRNTKRQIKDPDGFTLLETVISMMVFSIGILGMIALQSGSVRSNTLAEDVQFSTDTAMAQIEELMATDFLDQRLNVPSNFQLNDPRYRVTLIPLDNAAIPGAKRVEVQMQFTPPNGRPQTTTFKVFKPRIN